jgi:hypothetical protein
VRRMRFGAGAFRFSAYKDSALNAAGTKAYVRDVYGSDGIGLDLRNDPWLYIGGSGHPAYPGDWFVVDYYAEQAGPCGVNLVRPGLDNISLLPADDNGNILVYHPRPRP